MHLLQAQDALRLHPERADAVLPAGRQQRVPHVLAVLRRTVYLPPRFAHEPDLQQNARNPRNISTPHPHVAELRRRQIDLRQLRKRRPRLRSRDVYHRIPRRHVRHVSAHLPIRHPPLEPLLHRLDVRRRRRDVVPVLRQPGHRPVVHDRPVVTRHQPVPHPPRPQIGKAVRVHEVQELRRVLPPNVQLAQRPNVDHPHAPAHRLRLTLRIAVAVRTLPPPRLHHPRARLDMPPMHGRTLERHVRRPRQLAQRQRLNRRPGRRRTHLRQRAPRLTRQHLREPLVAHLPLARPHRHRAVPLQHLNVPEPLPHALHHVPRQHVLAVAHELARPRTQIHGRRPDRCPPPV